MEVLRVLLAVIKAGTTILSAQSQRRSQSQLNARSKQTEATKNVALTAKVKNDVEESFAS